MLRLLLDQMLDTEVLLPFLNDHQSVRFANRLVIVGANRLRWIATDADFGVNSHEKRLAT